MVQADNPSTLVVEAGGSDVENHPQLYIDFCGFPKQQDATI